MPRYDSAVAQPAVESAPPEPYRIRRRIPSHGATLEGDVVVPLLQSLVTGAIGALLGYAVADRPLIGFAVGFALAWLILLVQSRSLLWTLEETWNRDLTRDGHSGEPEPQPVRHTVRIEMTENDGRTLYNTDLPGPPEAITALAQGVLVGESLAEERWSGAGKPFSLNEYRACRAELLREGYIIWRNPKSPNQGVRLTGRGRLMFRKYLEKVARGAGE